MDFEKVMELPQALGLTGVANDRELGGYVNRDGRKLKTGKLLRTGHLHTLTESDADQLVNQYRVQKVIDFRSGNEIQGKPDVLLENCEYVWIPLLPESLNKDMDGSQVMHADDEFELAYEMIQRPFDIDSFYVTIMSREIAQRGYRQFFECLLELADDRALLWHCSAGKDRTGMAAVFLLALLDFDRDTMMQDYLLTNDFCAEKISFMAEKVKLRSDDPEMVVKMRSMFGVLPVTMNTLLDWCEEEYGSVKQYVMDVIGVSEDEIAVLKAKYLE